MGDTDELPDGEIDLDNPPFPLTEKDRLQLATRDEDFSRITWDDVQDIIAKNQLENLLRLPSDLHRYLLWSHKTKLQYGSITNFVIRERLHWTPVTTHPPTFAHNSPIPFHDERDYAILLNDWPYGLSPGITHLVVWSKTPIPVDEMRGDVTEWSRKVIEKFVDRTFRQEVEASGGDGRAQVTWFKNWVSLQSVRGVDHVHVLVQDVPETVLQKWLVRGDL